MGQLRLSALGKPRGVARRHPPFFRTRKLALIGNTPSKRHAPWFDPTWTIAAHTCCVEACLRPPDWWFDLHGPQNFRVGKGWSPHYYQWIKALQQPIFMQEDWPDVPMAVRFPKERILAEYRAYFTNHVAWMIALAMTEGVTHIGLYGCEYSHAFERGQQRGSAEFWLGMFEGRGGHVILPPHCTLLNDPPDLYGYESHDEQGKLKSSYHPKKAALNPSAPERKPMTLTIVDKLSEAPPLAKLPDGEAPALHRRV